MTGSRLAKALVAVLSFTTLALLSLYAVGLTAADSTLGSTARSAVGGLLAAATLGLLRYLTGLARADRRSSDGS
ncbi:hypothetical protein [Streptomyces sp. 6-11-2]|uniref:hypothetical protein n=1 Tax=unclassified Streptomyces TaxID=2593676 RepID=UPI001143D3A7|nr:hypothetical protein [Streptomyces sp. 6-11-2]GED89612.1 hypothetical protein TNCT6_66970 [Streptomyces sp. 6-11-2]